MGEVEEKVNPNPLIEDVKRRLLILSTENMKKIIHMKILIIFILTLSTLALLIQIH